MDGVFPASKDWSAVDEDDDSPRGYTALLVDSGGRGISDKLLVSGSVLISGVLDSGLRSAFGLTASGVFKIPPRALAVDGKPKMLVFGADVAIVSNFAGTGDVVGVVDDRPKGCGFG